MKSGTTTLADYLTGYSSIHIPNEELHYFDKEELFSKGVEWYSRALLQGWTQRGSPRDHNVLVGEKTPTYAYQNECAERIYELNPNVKLIWIFRNPIKRTFSNYLHARKNGSERLSFEKAIEHEQKRIQKDIFYGYVERSKYSDQVERFLRYFPRKQMHFMLFEDMLKHPERELDAVCDFLGIPHEKLHIPDQHSNKTRMPLWPESLWLAHKFGGRAHIIFKIIRRINLIFPAKTPTIDSKTARKLHEVFAPYNKKLAELTGLDLSVWEKF